MPAQLLTVKQIADLYGLTPQGVRHQLKGVAPDEQGGKGKASRYSIVRYSTHVFGRAGDSESPLDLTQERARLAREQADRQAMDNAERRGELAPMSWFEEQIAGYTRQLAAMLDALPMRIRQSLPHLTTIDHARIDRLLAEERARMARRLAGGGENGADGSGSSSNAAGEAAAVAAQ